MRGLAVSSSRSGLRLLEGTRIHHFQKAVHQFQRLLDLALGLGHVPGVPLDGHYLVPILSRAGGMLIQLTWLRGQ